MSNIWNGNGTGMSVSPLPTSGRMKALSVSVPVIPAAVARIAEP